MSKTILVSATKYRLKVAKSIIEGTWEKDGQREKIHTKVLARKFVEDRNAHDNNEHYVIDEKKSIELTEEREKNIIKNAAQAKREKMTMADLVETIANKQVPAQPAAEVPAAPIAPEAPKANETPADTEKKETPVIELNVTDNGDGETLFKDMSEDQIRHYSSHKGINQHHLAGKESMIEKIYKFNSNK